MLIFKRPSNLLTTVCRLSLCLLVLNFHQPIYAVEHADINLVGESKLRILFWDIYHSRLYMKDSNYEVGKTEILLELDYLRDIDADDLVLQTQKQWRALGIKKFIKPESLKLLLSIFPDVVKGDKISIYIDEYSRSVFRHNGVHIGTVEDSDFGHQFLAIWLSEKTSQPKQRIALLGKG